MFLDILPKLAGCKCLNSVSRYDKYYCDISVLWF